MGKQRSGQLSNEHVSLHTPRPRRRCGVSNGFQRQEGTKGLQQQARIAVSPFIGKLQEAEAVYVTDIHILSSLECHCKNSLRSTMLLRHLPNPFWI